MVDLSAACTYRGVAGDLGMKCLRQEKQNTYKKEGKDLLHRVGLYDTKGNPIKYKISKYVIINSLLESTTHCCIASILYLA
jgi:hypothetical protein